jgi:probable F420-dependent oxidoreductase
MKFGVTGYLDIDNPGIPEVARKAEALGFESLWTGEHIFVPVEIADPVRHGVPLPEMYKHLPDLFVILSAAAAVTTKLNFGTNICIAAQRHPLELAKIVATLDRISKGRVILGVGNGWIREEAEILGYDFDRKVGLTNEHIAALKTLWTEDEPSFSGEFVSFPPVHSNPKPHHKAGPPIIIGSGGATTDNSRILKRVARLADGWLPLDIGPEQMRSELAELKRLCDEQGRDFADLDISLILASPALGITDATGQRKSAQAEDLAGQYAEAGVGRIVVLPWGLSTSAALDFQSMEMLAAGLGL